MLSSFTIELKGLQFFSYHGLYEEEKITGGEFTVDLQIGMAAVKQISCIEETINYADLYALVKEEMQQPRELLETLVQAIASRIFTRYPQASELEIRIEKKTLPVQHFTGSAAVRFTLKR